MIYKMLLFSVVFNFYYNNKFYMECVCRETIEWCFLLTIGYCILVLVFWHTLHGRSHKLSTPKMYAPYKVNILSSAVFWQSAIDADLDLKNKILIYRNTLLLKFPFMFRGLLGIFNGKWEINWEQWSGSVKIEGISWTVVSLARKRAWQLELK